MRINLRKLASRIIKLSADTQVSRYYTGGLYVGEHDEPLLITLSARTLWGVMLLRSHWLGELTDNLGVVGIEEVKDKEAAENLKTVFTDLLFSGYGIHIYKAPPFDYADYGDMGMLTGEEETIDIVPLTDYPDAVE